MHRDFIEFIEALRDHHVEFVIVGGMALAFHGYPRFTGDLDVWVKPTTENGKRLFDALGHFLGTALDATPGDFLAGHNMIALGEEPVRIEVHHTLDGVTTDEIWDTKTGGTFGPVNVYYIGRDTFIKNKKTVGRDQDLVDIMMIQGGNPGKR